MSKVLLHPVPLCKGLQALPKVFEVIRENPMEAPKHALREVRRKPAGGFRLADWTDASVCKTHRQNAHKCTHRNVFRSNFHSFTLKKRLRPVRFVGGKDRSQHKQLNLTKYLINPGNAFILGGSNFVVHKNPYFKVKLRSLAFSHI